MMRVTASGDDEGALPSGDAALEHILFDSESVEKLAARLGCEATLIRNWRRRATATFRALDEERHSIDVDGRLAPEGDTASGAHSTSLHHVGIVAKDEEQIARFASLFGMVEVQREHLAKYRVTNVFLSTGKGAQVQFMLSDGGVLSNFNQGRGGLHHLALHSSDIGALQISLEQRGLRFIAKQKQKGIGSFAFNFVHPNVDGVAVELIEDPDFCP